MQPRPKEVWANGAAYERYVGRWSRRVAREFIAWLAVPAYSLWLDLGSGSGAISQTILQSTAPRRVHGLDRSYQFAAFAREQIRSEQLDMVTGDAQALPLASGTYDAIVSGLMLNFVPRPQRAVDEMARVARVGGVVGAYVWDYARGMEFMRHFWDAVVELDPAASELDEGPRFPICKPDALKNTLESAGLRDVQVRAIDITTTFRDFDDYWSPFLGGQGSAPTFLASLDLERQVALRENLRRRLPFAADGTIPLIARAWAVRGTR